MRIAVAGSSGRMGRTLIECVLKDPALKLAAALEQPGHALLGKDAGDLAGIPASVAIGADIEAALAASDAIIDFTRPAGTLAYQAGDGDPGHRSVTKTGAKLFVVD